MARSTPRSRAARLVVALLAILSPLAGCQTIAGIVDRHYESPDAAPPSDLCEGYCTTVMDACTDTFAVYPSKEACLGVCAHLQPGDTTAPTGNTVACRAAQAKLAKRSGEENTYCPAAGPGGAGTCGDDCDSYCTLYAELCPDDASSDCPRKCAVLVDDGTFDAKKNHDGDTLQCRLVHTGNATLDPATHCPHASLAPRAGSPCSIPTPNCDDYCRVVMAACTKGDAVYESPEQCKSVCAALDVGKSSDSKEDTLGCRTYHAYNALDIGPSHCPHAGPGGDGHCGTDNCKPYCRLLAAACPTEFATFATEADCESACNALPGAAKDSHGTLTTAKDGTDNVQCRLLHVSRAFAAKSECQSAMAGDPCSN